METLSPLLPPDSAIVRSVAEQFPSTTEESDTLLSIVETLSPQLALSGRKLVDSLSFSHFAELIEIEDPLKRAFYEIECIGGNWSVRALKRQIATLYYERSCLSTDACPQIKKNSRTWRTPPPKRPSQSCPSEIPTSSKKTGTPIKLLFLLGTIRNPPLENNRCPELFRAF